MNKLLTAALLIVTSAGLNLVAGCGKSCQKCVKQVTAEKRVSPKKECKTVCPEGYHMEGSKNGKQDHSKKAAKSASYGKKNHSNSKK